MENDDIKEAWRLYGQCKERLDRYDKLLREVLPHLERGQPILYEKILKTLREVDNWQGIKI